MFLINAAQMFKQYIRISLLLWNLRLLVSSANAFQCYTTGNVPINNIKRGCTVGNLTVIASNSGRFIVNQRCNQTVDSAEFNYPPIIKFMHEPVRTTRNQTYFMVIVDRTSESLLWMVANITAADKTTLSPGNTPWYSTFKNSLIVKSYQQPSLNVTSNNHTIEILIFEEKNPNPHKAFVELMRYTIPPKFVLNHWLQSYVFKGILLCGPVAGGQAIVYKKGLSHSYPSHMNIPSQYYPANLPSYNTYTNPPYNPYMPNPQVPNHNYAHAPVSQGSGYGGTKNNVKRNSGISRRVNLLLLSTIVLYYALI